MTNVAKHSQASRCSVTLTCLRSLELTVSDNGRGHGNSPRNGNGVGWTSMTERAAELGGSCTISNRGHGGGGLVVRAVLPLQDQGIGVLR